MKKNVIGLGLLFISFCLSSQLNITDADQELDCSLWSGSNANFYDSNPTGNYTPNQDETITICPDPLTGNKVSIAFAINVGLMFDVHGSDTIYVYDGTTTSSPLLGAHNSDTDPNGFTHSASFEDNPSGCLTIRFVSDGSDESAGWDANITCGNPPQPFDPQIDAFINGEGFPTSSETDMFPTDTGYVDVCLGDSILLNASGDFPYSLETTGSGYSQTNANCTYEWEFSNGTEATGASVWFTPPARAGYLVTLRMTDPINNIRVIQCKIRVSTIPSFSETTSLLDSICMNDSTILLGGVTNTDTVGVAPVEGGFEVGGVFAGLTYLPDGSGQNYETSVTISDFLDGQLITDVTDFAQLCVTMEHSYLGDLEMWLECPNGAQVNVFNSYSPGTWPGGFGGGTTFLGDALDNDIGNPGAGWEYCFSSNPAVATFDNMAVEYGNGNTIPTTISAGNAMNPNGIYLPEGDFNDFIGCPVNGDWSIVIRDNLGDDDGYIFEWGVFFNPSINPNTEVYSPEITSEFWSEDVTIIMDTDTLVLISPNDYGDNFYTFNVTDNFGCEYDTTISVFVFEDPFVNPSEDICDSIFTLQATNTPRGGMWQVNGPGTVTFTPNEYSMNPDVEFSTYGEYQFTFVDSTCGEFLETTITYQREPEVNIEDLTFCDGTTETLVAASPGSNVVYLWSDGSAADTLMVSSTGTYSVNVTNTCGSVEDDALITVDPCEIIATDIMTANGDGYNDNFIIEGIEAWPNSLLKIYDRWGKLVYENTNYQNDWNGTKKETGKYVSSGTYYWILAREIDEDPTHGYVTVVRKKQ